MVFPRNSSCTAWYGKCLMWNEVWHRDAALFPPCWKPSVNYTPEMFWVYIVSSYHRPLSLISRCKIILGKVPVSQWLEIMKSHIKLSSCYVPIMIYCTHYDLLITCKHINYMLDSIIQHCIYILKTIKILSYDKHLLIVTIHSSSCIDYVNFCCHLVSSQMLCLVASM